MSVTDVMSKIKQEGVRFVDLRFTDTRGKEMHMTLPASAMDEDGLERGKMFDGSSINGWKGIHESDMILKPDPASAVMDPFADEPTLNIRCDIVDPATLQGYERDPRSIAARAQTYLQSTGVADTALFGPEPEFFVLDDVRWGADISGAFYKVDSEESSWNAERIYEDGNIGHRPSVKGGYFPVPPVDSLHDLRAQMCLTLEEMGVVPEVHHHEVATAGQCEIGTRFNELVRKADELQILKYVVMNVAHAFGKTATFMPKPLVGDNGSGMHVHMSLSKDGQNMFAGDQYGGLSEEALYYIGGIIKHAKALNAFTNGSTNSYKRLVPGFEAPVNLAYSRRNRSAAVRIPMYSQSEKAKRFEFRCPDPSSNPYLGFAAMVMAAVDGIQNKINPGDPLDKDIYDLPPEEAAKVEKTPASLRAALEALEKDHDFLLQGDVFTEDVIETWIDYKLTNEVLALDLRPHPWEFALYYDI